MIISGLGGLRYRLAVSVEPPACNLADPIAGTDQSYMAGRFGFRALLSAAEIRVDEDSNIRLDFPKELQKCGDELVDSFLYLGPQDLRLRKKIPADIGTTIGAVCDFLQQGRGGAPSHNARPRADRRGSRVLPASNTPEIQLRPKGEPSRQK